eukprot:287549-Amphidinium_carterae.1
MLCASRFTDSLVVFQCARQKSGRAVSTFLDGMFAMTELKACACAESNFWSQLPIPVCQQAQSDG